MLIDSAGERIGRVEDIYTDDVGGYPAWMAVGTGRFGLNIIFLPFAAASPARGDELRVTFPTSRIKSAPSAGKGGRLTQDEVVRLYDHYGFDLEAEEVRERALHRRSSGRRTDYKPASPYVPVLAEEPPAPTVQRAPTVQPAPQPAPTVQPAPLALGPAPAERPAAVVVPVPPRPSSAPAEKAAAVQPAAPAPNPAPVEKAAAAGEQVAAPGERPPAPAAEPSKRPKGSLFRDLVDLTEESGVRPDSPLFWNHDDRIDSIRPPKEPARSGRH